ncbi:MULTISPECIES: sporulation protein [unclassified Streptomyces]|uniref:sporulation protein n=1 Tax=unclassified Streptomyces TaxID=2593676 RepID=UPI003324D613
MVLKRLFGGGIPLEVDTVIEPGPVRPGGVLHGEVVVRAPERDLEIESIHLKLLANAPLFHKGDGDGEGGGETVGYPSASGWFRLRKGQEKRVPLKFRLRWETPVNELRGEDLGIVIGVSTEVDAAGVKAQTDMDPVRVEALPLHEAVLDAFRAEGYALDGTRVYGTVIPDVERHLYAWQGFRLVRPEPAEGRPRRLELTFHTNAVGSEVFLRRFDGKSTYWDDKPPALRSVAAHHEVGTRDFAADVRTWLDEVAVLEEKDRDED